MKKEETTPFDLLIKTGTFSKTQYKVFETIKSSNLTSREISKCSGMSHAIAIETIKVLYDKGLVKRERLQKKGNEYEYTLDYEALLFYKFTPLLPLTESFKKSGPVAGKEYTLA